MAHSPDYKKAAGYLKRLGIIDYDLRRNLSTGQKSAITKLWATHNAELADAKQFLIRPDDFAVKRVSKSHAQIMSKSGIKSFPLDRQKFFIAKKGYDKVIVRGDTIDFIKAGKKSQMLLGDPIKLFKAAPKIQKKLKRNQLLTFKIGENSIASARYLTLKEMKDYLRHVVMPRFRKAGYMAAEFWPQVSIVTIEDMPTWMKHKEKTKGTPVKTRKKSKRGK